VTGVTLNLNNIIKLTDDQFEHNALGELIVMPPTRAISKGCSTDEDIAIAQ
jgi:hypothetical protein